MALLAVISGVVAVAAIVAGVVVLVVRTREVARGFRSFGGALEVELKRVDAASARLADAGPAAGESTARLAGSLERLAVSRARLAVLLGALADVRSAVTRLRAVAPRK